MATEPAPKKGGDWRPVVTLDRRAFAAILVGVCILSSAIGAGFGLIAETGPAGSTGKRGPAGPAGPEGPAGPSNQGKIEDLEAELEELQGEVSDGQGLEDRLEEVESALEELQGFDPAELCSEFDAFC
jgi:hypothetical protein